MPIFARLSRTIRAFAAWSMAALAGACAVSAAANSLEEEIGRSEVRIYSAPYAPAIGTTLDGAGLIERLERLGYQRLAQQPMAAGQFFWADRALWIYRRAYRHGGKEHPALLFALRLERAGKEQVVVGFQLSDGREPRTDKERAAVALEPEVLAESLDGTRARRVPVRLDQLPERVWRPLLAAEDARFFSHTGVDGIALARALLANAKAGKVAQGGSTITQQLIKNRDLGPERSLGRKASEAVRALALEARFDKKVILEAYLNQVYLGHVDRLAIHGWGTAARVYFGKTAGELTLAEAATLAAIVPRPNQLAPDRHPQEAKERRDWVLGRLRELEWASEREVAAARATALKLTPTAPRRPLARHLAQWAADLAQQEAPGWMSQGHGVVVESTLDPLVQSWAEQELSDGLRRLRGAYRALRTAPIEGALVTLDARNGAVVAHVGGDPQAGSELDRVRKAHRQPGSAIKPLLLLEALESCGAQKPLHPASRLDDAKLKVALPKGDWTPDNNDDRFRGAVSVRLALRHSLNVPFVRMAYHCGLEPVAARLRLAGLSLPAAPPPAFTLGAVEVTPLELAAAYSAIAGGGERVVPRPVTRLERPDGRQLERFRSADQRVASAETAYLVRDLLRDVARFGSAQGARLAERETAAKTGTSSQRKDAWLAGFSGDLVTVAWVGRDDGSPLGLTGAEAAAPLWQRFMAKAAATRAPAEDRRPKGIVERWVDPRTGLLVRASHRRAEKELFRRGILPPRDLLFWFDDPAPIIR